MSKVMPFVCALALCASAWGQESEKTTVTVTETKVPAASTHDTLNELWNFIDAVPVPAGEVQLRFTFRWETAGAPANRYDSNDDFILQPSLYWGAAENLELSLTVPVWVGDGGEMPGQSDGQADTYVSGLWRAWEQMDYWPAGGFSTTVRIPTGVRSDGIDAELRLVLTNEYDSGIRGHFNAWVETVNTTNGETNPNQIYEDGDTVWLVFDEQDAPWDPRDFQYGASVGVDGPLNDDGSLRWVVDYVYKSSQYNGHGGLNLFDVGFEWQMDESSKLGMSALIPADHAEDEAPNFGAAITYALALTY
jgi:hypothetical protein